MILAWLIITPVLGGLLGWLAGRRNPLWPRWVAAAAMVAELLIGLVLWGESPSRFKVIGDGRWLDQLDRPWIPQLGIHFHLALDGLSLLMVLLTSFIGIVSVVASWNEIKEHVGLFYLNLMAVLAGVVGVFLAMDLFLFYFFWELMLVPMYFLIVLWGDSNRSTAGARFFLFTQLSGLLMLVAILGLYFIHGRNTGAYTFDYGELLHTSISPVAQKWLLLGFVAAFLVKLPAVPLHGWLPDAYTSAPTAGSVVLAALMSKTAAYGLLRFAIPLFPHAVARFSFAGMVLAVIGILYGAVLAFAQTDLKRLVAYSSISHLGFVLLGIFAWSQLALQGVVLLMICHGISTGGLFILAGVLGERLHSRDLRRMGGLWLSVPRMGTATMVFAMASIGLPGLGNFIGEFLILQGAFAKSFVLTAIATFGFVFAAVYGLRMIQRIFYGPADESVKIADLKFRETSSMGIMILVLLWLGWYPQPVFNTTRAALEAIRRSADLTPGALSPPSISAPTKISHE